MVGGKRKRVANPEGNDSEGGVNSVPVDQKGRLSESIQDLSFADDLSQDGEISESNITNVDGDINEKRAKKREEKIKDRIEKELQ